MGYEDEMGEQELGLNISGLLQTVNFGRFMRSLAILLCDIFEMSFLTNLAFD